jgi:hypothetical protein
MRVRTLPAPPRRQAAPDAYPPNGLEGRDLRRPLQADAGPKYALVFTDRLLAERGFAVAQRPGLHLRTLADVVAYAEAGNVTLRIDGTETQVRRPKAGRPGRAAFVSGKRKQNTIKTTTISDGQGRTLWCRAVRPGRMHDQTAMRAEGIAEQFGSTHA